MNYLNSIEKLNNHYFALRHGKSEANQKGIILSNPIDGVNSYGLCEEGREQVKHSIDKNRSLLPNFNDIIIYTSDFKRALETAEIAAFHLGILEVHRTKLLRERYFGDFDKKEDSYYQAIWDNDILASDKPFNNVESVFSVSERTTRLVVDLEKLYKGKSIILVSHGDAIQILQTSFAGKHPSEHRNITHMVTAELRELVKI